VEGFFGGSTIERCFGFLKMYLNFTQPDTRLKFEEAVRTITQKVDGTRAIA
jgi:hypothetical protein